MLRCNKCDEPISEDRIIAYLSNGGQLPNECTACAGKDKRKIMGYMIMSGEKGSRKVGAELTVISPISNPNYDEMIRQASRVNKRSR